MELLECRFNRPGFGARTERRFDSLSRFLPHFPRRWSSGIVTRRQSRLLGLRRCGRRLLRLLPTADRERQERPNCKVSQRLRY
jgi:hypothetical protein